MHIYRALCGENSFLFCFLDLLVNRFSTGFLSSPQERNNLTKSEGWSKNLNIGVELTHPVKWIELKVKLSGVKWTARILTYQPQPPMNSYYVKKERMLNAVNHVSIRLLNVLSAYLEDIDLLPGVRTGFCFFVLFPLSSGSTKRPKSWYKGVRQ